MFERIVSSIILLNVLLFFEIYFDIVESNLLIFEEQIRSGGEKTITISLTRQRRVQIVWMVGFDNNYNSQDLHKKSVIFLIISNIIANSKKGNGKDNFAMLLFNFLKSKEFYRQRKTFLRIQKDFCLSLKIYIFNLSLCLFISILNLSHRSTKLVSGEYCVVYRVEDVSRKN